MEDNHTCKSKSKANQRPKSINRMIQTGEKDTDNNVMSWKLSTRKETDIRVCLGTQ